jgi:hypothetical protein
VFVTKNAGKTLITKTTGIKIASEGLKGRVFELSLADLNGGDESQVHFALQSLNSRLQSLRNLFAVASQSIHRRFAITSQSVQSFCDRFAIALQSLCNRFAIALQLLCSCFAVALQSLYNRFTDALQSHAITCLTLCYRLIVVLRSLRNLSAINAQ